MMSIKPEYLMEPLDYKHWAQLQKDIEQKKNKTGRREIRVKTEEEESLEDQLFEAVSKRAWTDVLLQLLKVGHLEKLENTIFIFRTLKIYCMRKISL